MGVALLVALLITIHCVKGLQWHSVQSARLVGSIFSENVLKPSAPLMWKELVNALPKVVGFLRVLRFPSTGNVDRVGWD
jgi:hypothetical protein